MKLWPLGLYRVAGESMAPTYAPGDTLLGWRWSRPRPRPRPGQVIVVHHSRPLIKRVKHISGDQIWLEGDNPAVSTDSRHFGPVSHIQVEAIIIKKL